MAGRYLMPLKIILFSTSDVAVVVIGFGETIVVKTNHAFDQTNYCCSSLRDRGCVFHLDHDGSLMFLQLFFDKLMCWKEYTFGF
jgi:hypothetical protein